MSAAAQGFLEQSFHPTYAKGLVNLELPDQVDLLRAAASSGALLRKSMHPLAHLGPECRGRRVE